MTRDLGGYTMTGSRLLRLVLLAGAALIASEET